MEDMRYDVEVLRKKVESLQAEYGGWEKIQRPKISGQGRTVAQMEKLADLYDEMYDILVNLARDTADCLTRIADCVENMDEASAEAFTNDSSYSEGEQP